MKDVLKCNGFLSYRRDMVKILNSETRFAMFLEKVNMNTNEQTGVMCAVVFHLLQIQLYFP